MQRRNPTQHNMTRRSTTHDYSRPGIYHITLHVEDSLGQPLGCVEGSPEAPRVALTPVGQMVERELLDGIRHHYPMTRVMEHIIMPEHLHFLLDVQDKILSSNGSTLHLGQVIAGFKQGCNRRYWEMTQRAKPVGTMPPAPTNSVPSMGSAPSVGGVPAVGGAPSIGGAPSVGRVPDGFSVGKPRFSTSRPPLFAPGYCDVMPVNADQLATQRAYIQNNPRTRLLRNGNRASLYTRRGGVSTALFPKALYGYLQRECGTAFTPDDWQTLCGQLLMAPDGTITCDTFGPRHLLVATSLLPVVCHRKDAARFAQQRQSCLDAATRGAVLVSPRIAKGEQAIIDEALHGGFPVVLIADNGFADRYHPSAERLALCAEGRLLLATPWRYQYRGKNEAIHVHLCKTMNCLAQALCRLKDNWWQTP